MTNTIGNNNFYKTFTPFLTPQTRTAEKTMEGRDFVVYKPPSNITKKFYQYISAGGFLLAPILALSLSKKSLAFVVNKSQLYHFRACNEGSSGFMNNVAKKFAHVKLTVARKFLELIRPYSIEKEIFSMKLNNPNNNSLGAKIFRQINNVFKTQKINAAKRQYSKISKNFANMEKLVNGQIDLIEKSAQGKLKIAFPKELLNNPADELPKVIDISKTADGKNRAEEARKLLQAMKNIFKANPNDYNKIAKGMTYSCENIFTDAERTLVYLNHSMHYNSMSTPKTKQLIKYIYCNLLKYRYAENIANAPNAIPKTSRIIYLSRIKEAFEKLKTSLPEPEKVKTYLDKFETLITNKAAVNAMGLLEKLRAIMKCNDIHPEIIRQKLHPSILKHYRTEDYIKMKRCISDFAKEIQDAKITQNRELPNALSSIDRGNAFIDVLSVLLPTGCLLANYKKNHEAKDKHNLISFLLGSLTMLGSHYFTMCTRKSSILLGLATAFIASRFLNKFSN